MILPFSRCTARTKQDSEKVKILNPEHVHYIFLTYLQPSQLSLIHPTVSLASCSVWTMSFIKALHIVVPLVETDMPEFQLLLECLFIFVFFLMRNCLYVLQTKLLKVELQRFLNCDSSFQNQMIRKLKWI